MIRTVLSTFVAWWIGACWGYLGASLLVVHAWRGSLTFVVLALLVLYPVYFSLAPWSRRVFRRLRAYHLSHGE